MAAAVVIVIALRAPFATLPLGVDEGGLAYVASRWDSGTGWLYGPHWVDRRRCCWCSSASPRPERRSGSARSVRSPRSRS